MRKFSEEYKTDAVKMVLENGLQTSRVANDLGIGKSTLDKWVKVYRSKTQPAGTNINDKEEIRRLRAENQKLKLERDLLKKATLFFANDRSI
jgi:transposase